MAQSAPSMATRPRTPPSTLPYNLDRYPGTRIQGAPSSPVRIREPSFGVVAAQAAQVETASNLDSRRNSGISRKPVGSRPGLGSRQTSVQTIDENQPSTHTDPSIPPMPRRDHSRTLSAPVPTFSLPEVVASDYSDLLQPTNGDYQHLEEPQEVETMPYHHTFEPPRRKPVPHTQDSHYRIPSGNSSTPTLSSAEGPGSAGKQRTTATSSPQGPSRPMSAMTLGSELHLRGRSTSPQDFRSDTSLSPSRNSRGVSTGRSPHSDYRTSTIDLLNIPYSQQMAHHNLAADNGQLRGLVGSNASLLDVRKTLEMYRANVKKTNDPAIQYEFAIFMVNAALEAAAPPASANSRIRDASPVRNANDREELLNEAKQILQKLADRSYVYAQYYLADGYSSGLFNRGKEDHDHAFPLFVSAGKHGHAEAAYRAALCYEFGWGSRKDYAKAVQFYRQAATKNHPGAATRLGLACMHGEMGLQGRYREGVKWLKRATESADPQHNAAPYELGLMHISGYGDDIFKDESYAAQLFTKAAELGHAEASLRMGEAYEHGLLTCPKDPALSIHFYTGAANGGIPEAMMALCAWYMVGAEPVLEKSEEEAFEWAKRSAEAGYAKAEYAVGYFREMGIGCSRDPLDANVWYVRAADHGEGRAKQRLAIIRAAETGEAPPTNRSGKGVKKKKSGFGGLFGSGEK